jgi:hypothetical protein
MGQGTYDAFKKGDKRLTPVIKTGISELKDLRVKNPEKDEGYRGDSCIKYIRTSTIKYDFIKMYTGMLENVTPYIKGNKKITLLFYSPAAGVTVELFLQNDAMSEEDYPKGRHSMYRAITLNENQWEVLTFDFIFQPDDKVSSSSINEILIHVAPDTNNGDTYYLGPITGPGKPK